MDNIFDRISDVISKQLSDYGFEFNHFLIGWYNECVGQEYCLPYDNNTLAFVLLSTPDMFEKAFLPFAKTYNFDSNQIRDPIDECMKYYFNRLEKSLSCYSPQIIHDFELLNASRKPKVLVQTAAHVSGAAYYYRPVNGDNNLSKTKIGVCIHPQYGGWFAIRGVIILRTIVMPTLEKVQPLDVIDSEDINKLLNNFNNNWHDWSYRDIINVTKKYSELQRNYFQLKPPERLSFLKRILDTK